MRKTLATLSLILLSVLGNAQVLVHIQDVLRYTDGGYPNGQLLISQPHLTDANGVTVVKGIQTYYITHGVVDLYLTPNLPAPPIVPAGTTYAITYKLDRGTSSDTWSIPSGGPWTVAQISVPGPLPVSPMVSQSQLTVGAGMQVLSTFFPSAVDITPPATGIYGCYWNTSAVGLRCWNGTTWQNIGGGGGGGSPGGLPNNVQYYGMGGIFSGVTNNASGTTMYLSQTSGGIPVWGAISVDFNQLTGTATLAQLPGSGVTTVNGQACALNGTCTISTAPSGAAGGDLGSTFPNPTVLATHLSAPLPRAQGGLNSASAGTGILRDGSTPTASEISGDASTFGSNVLTFATVNASPGVYGDASHVAVVTVNGKGLVPTVTSQAIAIPFTSVTGSIAIGQTALTTRGDIGTVNSSGALSRLALGSANLYPKSNGSDLIYSTLAAAGVGNCASNQYAIGLNADAAPTCAQVAYGQVSGTPTLFYQTLQAATVDQTQRSKLNFSGQFSLADSASPSKTTVDLAATITANTSGNAGTATALAATPTTCTAGNAATGVLANGNATGCFAPAGGVTMVFGRTGDVVAVTNDYTAAQVTNAFSIIAVNTLTNAAAPTSPSSGFVKVWPDSTDLRFHDKNSAGVIGTTVVASTAPSNQVATGISAAGVVAYSQLGFSNLSGSISCGQLAALTGAVTTSGCAATLSATGVSAGTYTKVTVGVDGRISAGATAAASDLSNGTTGAGAIVLASGSISGNAATATALASTPTICSSGQAARGVLASGNATGCFTPSGGGSYYTVSTDGIVQSPASVGFGNPGQEATGNRSWVGYQAVGDGATVGTYTLPSGYWAAAYNGATISNQGSIIRVSQLTDAGASTMLAAQYLELNIANTQNYNPIALMVNTRTDASNTGDIGFMGGVSSVVEATYNGTPYAVGGYQQAGEFFTYNDAGASVLGPYDAGQQTLFAYTKVGPHTSPSGPQNVVTGFFQTLGPQIIGDVNIFHAEFDPQSAVFGDNTVAAFRAESILSYASGSFMGLHVGEITGAHVVNCGICVDAVESSNDLQIIINPGNAVTDGDTFSVTLLAATNTYTLRTSLTSCSPGDVLIDGAGSVPTTHNMVLAMMGTGIDGVNYCAGTDPVVNGSQNYGIGAIVDHTSTDNNFYVFSNTDPQNTFTVVSANTVWFTDAGPFTYVASPAHAFAATGPGDVLYNYLSGSGSRLVKADSNGLLSAADSNADTATILAPNSNGFGDPGVTSVGNYTFNGNVAVGDGTSVGTYTLPSTLWGTFFNGATVGNQVSMIRKSQLTDAGSPTMLAAQYLELSIAGGMSNYTPITQYMNTRVDAANTAIVPYMAGVVAVVEANAASADYVASMLAGGAFITSYGGGTQGGSQEALLGYARTEDGTFFTGRLDGSFGYVEARGSGTGNLVGVHSQVLNGVSQGGSEYAFLGEDHEGHHVQNSIGFGFNGATGAYEKSCGLCIGPISAQYVLKVGINDGQAVVDGDNVTINGDVLTFRSTLAGCSANDVSMGGGTDEAVHNLVLAIGGNGTEGVNYCAGTIGPDGPQDILDVYPSANIGYFVLWLDSPVSVTAVSANQAIFSFGGDPTIFTVALAIARAIETADGDVLLGAMGGGTSGRIVSAGGDGTLFADDQHLAQTAGIQAIGTTFTFASNTCGATSLVGGGTAGSFLSGTTGVCTVEITLNAATPVGNAPPTGWTCDDSTHKLSQTASTSTTCTLSGTTVTGDPIFFHATAW